MEKRRYKITGFREIPNSNDVRVLLVQDEPIKPVKQPKRIDMMLNPQGFAQELIQNQVNQMIHDTFLITKSEYHSGKYMVGETLKVTIEKE